MAMYPHQSEWHGNWYEGQEQQGAAELSPAPPALLPFSGTSLEPPAYYTGNLMAAVYNPMDGLPLQPRFQTNPSESLFHHGPVPPVEVFPNTEHYYHLPPPPSLFVPAPLEAFPNTEHYYHLPPPPSLFFPAPVQYIPANGFYQPPYQTHEDFLNRFGHMSIMHNQPLPVLPSQLATSAEYQQGSGSSEDPKSSYNGPKIIPMEEMGVSLTLDLRKEVWAGNNFMKYLLFHGKSRTKLHRNEWIEEGIEFVNGCPSPKEYESKADVMRSLIAYMKKQNKKSVSDKVYESFETYAKNIEAQMKKEKGEE